MDASEFEFTQDYVETFLSLKFAVAAFLCMTQF